MTFIDELAKSTNRSSFTENGALTNTSTLDPVLDFFSRAGAMRGNKQGALELFEKAYAEDPQLAVRALFYMRDIRGGQGERELFKYIFNNFSDTMKKNLSKYIPEYGRWDEVVLTEGTAKFLYEQFVKDEKDMEAGKSVSLLAKWLPSENATEPQRRKDAKKLMDLWGLKPRQYRKRVVALREYIVLLEQLMSGKKWDEIDFSKIPSQAHKKHVKAFMRNTGERYKEYLEKLKSGDKSVKINSGTLMTYQIYSKVMDYNTSSTEKETMQQMWNSLPDFTQGNNALCVVDVSGSMQGLSWIGIRRQVEPMSVAVSLAIYFAERNKGPFKDYFMTFESRSRLIKLSANGTLESKIRTVLGSGVGGSTNIQSAFDEILKAAVASKCPPEEMPKTLYILSDMEFNVATSNNDETNFEVAKRKFKEHGYELPHLVFWNLEARRDNSPVTKFEKNCTLVSGFNQSTFKHVVEGKNPMESMLSILNSERYEQIKI